MADTSNRKIGESVAIQPMIHTWLMGKAFLEKFERHVLVCGDFFAYLSTSSVEMMEVRMVDVKLYSVIRLRTECCCTEYT